MRSSHDSQYSKGAASAWMQPLPFFNVLLVPLKRSESHRHPRCDSDRLCRCDSHRFRGAVRANVEVLALGCIQRRNVRGATYSSRYRIASLTLFTPMACIYSCMCPYTVTYRPRFSGWSNRLSPSLATFWLGVLVVSWMAMHLL